MAEITPRLPFCLTVGVSIQNPDRFGIRRLGQDFQNDSPVQQRGNDNTTKMAFLVLSGFMVLDAIRADTGARSRSTTENLP